MSISFCLLNENSARRKRLCDLEWMLFQCWMLTCLSKGGVSHTWAARSGCLYSSSSVLLLEPLLQRMLNSVAEKCWLLVPRAMMRASWDRCFGIVFKNWCCCKIEVYPVTSLMNVPFQWMPAVLSPSLLQAVIFKSLILASNLGSALLLLLRTSSK